MLWTMIRKEWVRNLLELRFMVCASLCVCLALISVIVLRADLAAKRADFSTNREIYRQQAEEYGSYRDLLTTVPNCDRTGAVAPRADQLPVRSDDELRGIVQFHQARQVDLLAVVQLAGGQQLHVCEATFQPNRLGMHGDGFQPLRDFGHELLGSGRGRRDVGHQQDQ